MQANVKKAKCLMETDDRDDDPLYTFNSMGGKDSTFDDDPDDFIRNFSEMTELH